MKRTIITILLFLIAAIEICSATRYWLWCDSKLLDASRDSLQSQVGVREETGRNDGKKVECYLRSVGLPKGNPYCAAGQYWCFYTAARDLNMPESAIPIYKTGSTVAMFDQAAKIAQKTNYKPSVDDLMFWRRPSQLRGHVERIIEVNKAGWVTTIGFNTSCGSRGNQYEGEGVFKRRRNVYHPLGRMVVRGLVGFKL